MPAEWEPHEATWLAWPHNEDDWPGRFEPIPWVYGEIVRKLSQVEKVRILLQNDDVEYAARKVLDKVGAQWEAIEFYPLQTDRVWTRDFAPTFVKTKPKKLPRSNGVSTAGRNTGTTIATKRPALRYLTCRRRWWRPEVVLEGAASTSTARACFSQPRNACLARCRHGTPI